MTIKPKAMCGEIPVYCSHDKLEAIMKVIPNPKNPNQHPDKQIKILSQIIEAQGWRKPITVSKRSGYVVSGHGRLLAALLLGAEKVPVDYQDYANEAEEWSDLVADNRLSELSSVDEDLLSDILGEINKTDFDVLLTGYDEIELSSLIREEEVTQAINNLDFIGYEPPSESFSEPYQETHTEYAETPADYQETIEKRKEQTGEIDLEDFAEENYQHQCPKCKFMW